MMVARAIAVLWLPVFHRYRSRDIKHVPTAGAVILAPNHTSYLDPVVITYPLRHRRLYYLAWHQLFANRYFAALIRRLGAIPLDTDRRADRAAFEAALALLRDGEAVCLFPEGIRGWDGQLYSLQSGVARLAVASGAPIIPVAVSGTLEAWPRWRRLPRAFVPITVRFLPPILPRPAATSAERKAETLRLMGELRDSLTQALERPARH